MRKLATVLVVAAAVAFLAPTARAAVDAKDLVGTWVIEKGDAPKGATLEFTKDGKLKVTIEKDTHEGTYKLDGDKLTITVGEKDKDTVTIKELTKDKMVVVDKDKKETELKKK